MSRSDLTDILDEQVALLEKIESDHSDRKLHSAETMDRHRKAVLKRKEHEAKLDELKDEEHYHHGKRIAPIHGFWKLAEDKDLAQAVARTAKYLLWRSTHKRSARWGMADIRRDLRLTSAQEVRRLSLDAALQVLHKVNNRGFAEHVEFEGEEVKTGNGSLRVKQLHERIIQYLKLGATDETIVYAMTGPASTSQASGIVTGSDAGSDTDRAIQQQNRELSAAESRIPAAESRTPEAEEPKGQEGPSSVTLLYLFSCNNQLFTMNGQLD